MSACGRCGGWYGAWFGVVDPPGGCCTCGKRENVSVGIMDKLMKIRTEYFWYQERIHWLEAENARLRAVYEAARQTCQKLSIEWQVWAGLATKPLEPWKRTDLLADLRAAISAVEQPKTSEGSEKGEPARYGTANPGEAEKPAHDLRRAPVPSDSVNDVESQRDPIGSVCGGPPPAGRLEAGVSSTHPENVSKESQNVDVILEKARGG